MNSRVAAVWSRLIQKKNGRMYRVDFLKTLFQVLDIILSSPSLQSFGQTHVNLSHFENKDFCQFDFEFYALVDGFCPKKVYPLKMLSIMEVMESLDTDLLQDVFSFTKDLLQKRTENALHEQSIFLQTQLIELPGAHIFQEFIFQTRLSATSSIVVQKHDCDLSLHCCLIMIETECILIVAHHAVDDRIQGRFLLHNDKKVEVLNARKEDIIERIRLLQDYLLWLQKMQILK
jgi:hypothetical protein